MKGRQANMSQSPSLFPRCLGAAPVWRAVAGLLLNRQQPASQPASRLASQPASCHASTRFVLLFVLEHGWAVSLGISFFPSATKSSEPLSVAGIALWSAAAPGTTDVFLKHRGHWAGFSGGPSVVAGATTLLLPVAVSPPKAKEAFMPSSDWHRSRGAR